MKQRKKRFDEYLLCPLPNLQIFLMSSGFNSTSDSILMWDWTILNKSSSLLGTSNSSPDRTRQLKSCYYSNCPLFSSRRMRHKHWHLFARCQVLNIKENPSTSLSLALWWYINMSEVGMYPNFCSSKNSATLFNCSSHIGQNKIKTESFWAK